jgi:hypothetical protein
MVTNPLSSEPSHDNFTSQLQEMAYSLDKVEWKLTVYEDNVFIHLLKLFYFRDFPAYFNNWTSMVAHMQMVHKVKKGKGKDQFPDAETIFEWIWMNRVDSFSDHHRIVIRDFNNKGNPEYRDLPYIHKDGDPLNAEKFMAGYYEWLATELSKKGYVKLEYIQEKIKGLFRKYPSIKYQKQAFQNQPDVPRGDTPMIITNPPSFEPSYDNFVSQLYEMAYPLDKVERNLTAYQTNVFTHLLKLFYFRDFPDYFNNWTSTVAQMRMVHKVKKGKGKDQFPDAETIFEWVWMGRVDSFSEHHRGVVGDFNYKGNPEYKDLPYIHKGGDPLNAEKFMAGYYEWLATELSKKGNVRLTDIQKKIEELLRKYPYKKR